MHIQGTQLFCHLKDVFNVYFHLMHPDAAYRFYRNRSEKESIDRHGLASDKLIKKWRHERIIRVRKL